MVDGKEVKVRLWLDDERPAPDGWTWVKDAASAIGHLESGLVTEASLDHDLGSGQASGYDVLAWVEEKAAVDPTFELPEVFIVHTMNPWVGRGCYRPWIRLRGFGTGGGRP